MSMLTRAEVKQRLRDACAKAGSQNKWAKRVGLSQTYVGNVLMGKIAPGPSLLKALGLKKVIMYQQAPKGSPKGLLRPDPL